MRREFPKRVKVAVIKRATVNGGVFCEKCGLPAKKFQIDHVIADALGGQPIIENAMLLCDECYNVKNPDDTKKAAKVKRIEAKHLGATMRKARIPNRGFPKAEKPNRIEKPPLPPRRAMYEDVR